MPRNDWQLCKDFMGNWTEQNLRDYTQRRLKDSERARERMLQNANRDTLGLSAAVAQPDHGLPLDRPEARETPRSTGVAKRLKITFVVRSQRPRDWDNSCTKFLQDRLIEAGILHGDSWDILEGTVISRKAASLEEAGTTVIIEETP